MGDVTVWNFLRLWTLRRRTFLRSGSLHWSNGITYSDLQRTMGIYLILDLSNSATFCVIGSGHSFYFVRSYDTSNDRLIGTFMEWSRIWWDFRGSEMFSDVYAHVFWESKGFQFPQFKVIVRLLSSENDNCHRRKADLGPMKLVHHPATLWTFSEKEACTTSTRWMTCLLRRVQKSCLVDDIFRIEPLIVVIGRTRTN
jgi:hypothetical protein